QDEGRRSARNQPPQPHPEDARLRTRRRGPGPPEPLMSGLVLIAEGDPFNLRLLEELCEQAGCEVVTAGDGSAALTVIARQRPALVVLYTALTTDDDVPVLEVLQSDATLSRIPVLLTTEAGDEESA